MQYKRILRIFVTILTASAAAALFLPAGAAPSGTLDPAVDKPAQWASISSYASKVQERLSKNPCSAGSSIQTLKVRHSLSAGSVRQTIN